jgi:uncharacterized protein (TIGR00369 family)
MSEADTSDPLEALTHPMAGHVIGQIGLHAVGHDDPCGSGIHLHLSPLLLEDDGHIDFGVLGVFLDMACSQVSTGRGFVHADISVHRIARPVGDKVSAHARVLRSGKRTSIVQIEAFDNTGVRVADSTQQTVNVGPPPDLNLGSAEAEEMRSRFMNQFDGICRLEGRLHDIIGLARGEADDGTPYWTMPSGPATQNGHGALHGGVAFDLVTDAAVGGALLEHGPAEAKSALLRYMAPADVGPFRAVPTVMAQGDGSVFVRVEVFDDGQDAKLCTVGEVHLAVTKAVTKAVTT